MIYLNTKDSESLKIILPKKTADNSATVFYLQDVSEISRIQVFLESFLEQEISDINYNINEIFLIVDEIMSNAIISSYNSNPEMKEEYLIASWKLKNNHLVFQTIDFGLGLDIKKIEKEVPDLKADNYFDQVIQYQETHKIQLMNKGETMHHHCTGRGLGIIREFSAKVELKYLSRKWELQDKIEEDTLGTIFTCFYNLKS